MKTLVELKKIETKLSQNYDKDEKYNRFSLFYYECVKRIKEVFTDKYYNENLAVNTLIHILYNQDALSGYFPSILWYCYGHIVVDNICNNLDKGYIPVSSKRKAYKQAIIGNEDVDKKIDELLHKEPLVITQNEFEYIQTMTKNNKATVQSKVVFSLLCMYKAMVINSKRNAEDIWLRIYMNKQQKKSKNKKGNNERKVCHNLSELDKLSSVSNGQSKIKMSAMVDNDFFKIRYKPYKYYEIQFKQDGSDEVFKIPEYKNELPELYAFAGYTDKVVRVCTECGKKFLVDSKKDRSVTCNDVCKKLRIQRQKAQSYEAKKHTGN